MHSDWKDRKGRFPIHYLFDGMCLDTFLIVSRIDFLFLFLCSFWGGLIRGSRAGESQLTTASVSCPRVLGGLPALSCLLCSSTGLCRAFSESKVFVWRAGSPHPFHRRDCGVGTR